MTSGIALRDGYKFINPNKPEEGQVLESVDFGEGFCGAPRAIIGPDCTFGNHVNLDYTNITIGEHVTVGNSANLKGRHIGDRVTIGNRVIIGDGAVLEDDVFVGNNVVVGTGVKVKSGVVIPDNWEIPYGCILNPGPEGAPVVIPPQPQFHCNVTATGRW